jgi:transcriptional regulator with XRE-family HTH domain
VCARGVPLKTSSYKDFGEFLKLLRIDAKLSQPDVAARLNTTQQTVSRWESGSHRPRSNDIGKLANLFRVNGDELLVRAGYKTTVVATPFVQPLPLDGLTWADFERFSCYFLERLYPNAERIHQMGGAGHTQDGLDIFVVLGDAEQIDFQCKRYKKFGPTDLDEVVSDYKGTAAKRVILISRDVSPRALVQCQKYADWDIWGKEDISRKFRQLPKPEQRKIVDLFFRGSRLALLGEAESGPWMCAEDFFSQSGPDDMPLHHKWSLIGRQADVENLSSALFEPHGKIRILKAPGGWGKSRILKAVADRIRAIDCGVPVWCAGEGAITKANISELGTGRCVLLVDDAHERNDLGELFRAAAKNQNVSVILATRPWPETDIFGTAAITSGYEEFSLEPLPAKQAVELSKSVLKSFGLAAALAPTIADRCTNNPMEIILTAYALARNEIREWELTKNDSNAERIIRSKYARVLSGSVGGPEDDRDLRLVLRLFALLQPIDVKDDRFVRLVEDLEKLELHETRKILRALINSGCIQQRGGGYRLVPDMLADLLLEEHCIGVNECSSGWAERVFGVADGQFRQQIFLNIAKLEWRLVRKHARSTLMNGLWEKLNPQHEYQDPDMGCVETVAYYQPERALTFCEKLVRQRKFVRQLPPILKIVSEYQEYLERVCDCLWKIGKTDTRELNPNPEHAIRILREFCTYDPRRNIAFISQAIDIVFGYLEKHLAEDLSYSPLDVLEGLFETQVGRLDATEDGGVYRRFSVPPTLIAPLRKRLLIQLLDKIGKSPVSLGVSITKLVGTALRYPVNSREGWTEHICELLAEIERVFSTSDFAPPIRLQLLRAVKWHASHGPSETSTIAQRILDLGSNSLEFRVHRAFTDGWGYLLEAATVEESEKQRQQWLEKLALDLRKKYGDDLDLICYLDEQLQSIRSAVGKRGDSEHVLIWAVANYCSSLPSSMVEFVLEHPESALCEYAEFPLARLLEQDLPAGLRAAEAFLNSRVDLASQVGPAIWRSRCLNMILDPTLITLLKELCSSASRQVIGSTLIVLRVLSMSEPRVTLKLAKLIKIQEHPDIAEAFFEILSRENVIAHFNEHDAAHHLKSLDSVDDLDQYGIDCFLSALSQRHSKLVAGELMRRVERAAQLNRWAGVVDFGTGHRVRMRFRDAEDFSDLLDMVLRWMAQNEGRLFRMHATTLFRQMFEPFDSQLVELLQKHLDIRNPTDLVLFAQLLEKAPRTFVFEYQSLIFSLFESGELMSGHEVEILRKNLFRSTTSGLKSAKVGEPFEEDVEIANGARVALASLNRTDAAYQLYDDLANYADAEILRANSD